MWTATSSTSSKELERLTKLLHPKLLGNAVKLMRRALPTMMEMDPRAEAFLKEMDKVDYGLMDDCAG